MYNKTVSFNVSLTIVSIVMLTFIITFMLLMYESIAYRRTQSNSTTTTNKLSSSSSSHSLASRHHVYNAVCSL